MLIRRKAFVLPHVLVFCAVVINFFYLLLNIVSIENKLSLIMEEGIEQEIIVYENKDEIVNFIKDGLDHMENTVGHRIITYRKVTQTTDPNIKIANVNIKNLNNDLQTTFIIHYDLINERIIYWIKTG